MTSFFLLFEINKGIAEDERNNTARVEKIKEEPETITTTTTTLPNEQIETSEQSDPEDEDTFDSSPYYENDDD